MVDVAILPISTIQQPVPFLVPRGDCGACVLGALSGMSIDQVYDYHGDRDGLTHECMEQLCKRLLADGKFLDVVAGYPELAPESLSENWCNTFGRPGWMNWYRWWDRAQYHLYHGYYGVASVAFAQDGHITAQADHFIMINGYEWKGDGASDKRLIISCSARGRQTVPVKDFLKYWGGYNTIFVKPKL